MDWDEVVEALPYALLILFLIFAGGFASGYIDAAIGNYLSVDIWVNNTGNSYAIRLKGPSLRDSPVTLEMYDNSTTYFRWSGRVTSGDVVTVSGVPVGERAVLRIIAGVAPDILGTNGAFQISAGEWTWGMSSYYVVPLEFHVCGAGRCSTARAGFTDALRYALFIGVVVLLLFIATVGPIVVGVVLYVWFSEDVVPALRKRLGEVLERWRRRLPRD